MHALRVLPTGIFRSIKDLYHRLQLERQQHLSFFYEALAVLSVLYDARRLFPSHRKIVIYTDNFTMVVMFNSLRALLLQL